MLLILWIYVVFYVPLLNRFTVEETEESVSNVTAEKETAQTDRQTPFWRIKSVKWLWESVEPSWMCAPGWRALRKTPRFLLPRLNPFSFSLALLVKLWPVALSFSFFKVDFSLKCSARSQLSAFCSRSLPPFFYFFYFWSNHFQFFCTHFDFHLLFLHHSIAATQTVDCDTRFTPTPTVQQPWSHYLSPLE